MLNWNRIRSSIIMVCVNAMLVGFNLRALLVTDNWDNLFIMLMCAVAAAVNAIACWFSLSSIKRIIESEIALNRLGNRLDEIRQEPVDINSINNVNASRINQPREMYLPYDVYLGYPPRQDNNE